MHNKPSQTKPNKYPFSSPDKATHISDFGYILFAMKPHRQRTRLSPCWAFLGCPLVSLVLGLLLFANAANMPQTTPVGRFINQPSIRGDSVYFIAYLTRAADIQPDQPVNPKYRLLDIDRESSDELTRLLTQNTQPVLEVMIVQHIKTSGIWSAWTTQPQWQLTLSPLNTNRLDIDLTVARKMLLYQRENIVNIDSFSTRFVRALDDITNPPKPTVHWRGLANDLMVLTAWILLGLSIFRWRSWFAQHPLSRTSRRIARNQCPACGYSLHNLPSDTCPECVTPLNQNRA